MTEVGDALKGRLILGIDLGTTNSGVAVWREATGRVEMLPGADGDYLLPSAVGWDDGRQEWLVGREAQELRSSRPDRVATSVKRFIGRWYADPVVLYGQRGWAYPVLPASGKDPLRDVLIDFGGSRLTAPEVSAHVLRRLRQDAATALGLPLDEVRHAVVTVPAYFNVLQREATVLAGQLAGLEVVDLLNEPTAAALAYADSVLPPGAEQRILVFDLGGGTFDVSLLEATRDSDGYVFATRVVDGDTCLGGDDIDAALTRWLTEEIERKHGRSIPAGDGLTRDRLRRAAETAKIAGSQADEVMVELPGLDPGGAGPFDVRFPVSRSQLEACARDVVGRATAVARRAVEDVAGLKWTDIDAVILVGGQTRMPAVRRAVADLWGRPPLADERPQLVVALGAGEYAHNLSLGRERFYQNALINVLALPVGIRLDENAFEALVPANATVPYRSRPFAVTTTEDNQTQIRVEILQGPRGASRADECVLLGGVEMAVLPAPARTPKFEVRFDAQVDGTLLVEVNDFRTGTTEKTTIRPGGIAWKGSEGRPTPPL